MTDSELLQSLDRLKAVMIAVATGGPRIGQVQLEYTEIHDSVSTELAARQIHTILPYRDLWEWYGRWSNGDLPTWQSRRNFVNNLFQEIIAQIRGQSLGAYPPVPHQKTSEISPEGMQWDVFLSHAHEDKEDFARPLAERLRELGLKVWFDEFTFVVGDSLRQTIDRGLANSRFGIVVISRAFLTKHWPQWELDGMAAREVAGTKVILPVWHGIGADEIQSRSPLLAGRYAVPSSAGLGNVADALMRAIRRDSKSPAQSDDQSPRARATSSSFKAATAIPDELVALGPDIICTGEFLGFDQGEWRLQLREFVIGDVGTLLGFVEGLDNSNGSDRYVLVNALGDGRRLTAAPSLTKEGGSYIARCPVAASFPRIAAQNMPSEFAASEDNNDLYLNNGDIARLSGVDVLPQRIRSALSMIRGESTFDRYCGSRLQEYYWSFRESPLLESVLKLEIVRQAAIPYDFGSTAEHTSFRCVERVQNVGLLASEPVEGRLPLRVELDVQGLGRWTRDISVLMPSAEKVRELSERWKLGSAPYRQVEQIVKTDRASRAGTQSAAQNRNLKRLSIVTRRWEPAGLQLEIRYHPESAHVGISCCITLISPIDGVLKPGVPVPNPAPTAYGYMRYDLGGPFVGNAGVIRLQIDPRAYKTAVRGIIYIAPSESAAEPLKLAKVRIEILTDAEETLLSHETVVSPLS